MQRPRQFAPEIDERFFRFKCPFHDLGEALASDVAFPNVPVRHVLPRGRSILTEDRIAQAQSYIDAIKAKAQDDLAELARQAGEAKERLASDVSALQPDAVDEVEAAPPQDTFEVDDQPTITMELPDELITDFDPGAPQSASETIESDALTDEEGIPLWEDPS